MEDKEAATPLQPDVAPPPAAGAAGDDDEPEELWDDSDEEHDADAGERAAPQPPAEPTVPIRFEDVISGDFDAEVEQPGGRPAQARALAAG